ncbi:MAG TPA: LysM peptidoglycan-binding domain-containing protein [Candidatus Onthousia faecipullorum]|uniref:LysM peptidoglycan-binding domain-containing protein n=1 Tax=Candidatus Onthousia faecipullorum TaxID=2840887 RepID=A0A9D1KCE5_9FIRM|nr:LysM peptidoglycan-binding domain-containing protein [Candidatus Onthousia faecipullorum]
MKQIITLEKEIAFKTMVGEISSISLEPDLDFINDTEIEGNLIISGTYKMTEASTIEEDFSYKVPVEIMLTTALEEDTRKVDINNFTYGIVNEEALSITVELLIEGLEKVDIEDTLEEENKDVEEVIETKEEVPVMEEETDIRSSEDKEESTDREEIEVLTTEEEKKQPTFEEKLPSLEDVTIKEEKPTIKEDTIEVESTLNEDNTSNKQVMDSIFSAFANTEETYSTYSVYILREDDNLEEVMAKYKTNRETLAEYNDLENLKVGSKLIIPTVLEVND